MSEWGNPAEVNALSSERKLTQGSETSQYLEEKKANAIPGVAASEMGLAQTCVHARGGCRTTTFKLIDSRTIWKVGP